MILKNIFIFSKQGKQSEINLDNPKGASFKENHQMTTARANQNTYNMTRDSIKLIYLGICLCKLEMSKNARKTFMTNATV